MSAINDKLFINGNIFLMASVFGLFFFYKNQTLFQLLRSSRKEIMKIQLLIIVVLRF
jgi:hypothetical protein